MISVPSFWRWRLDPKIGQLVVEHKDRASRFGVAYIQTLLAMQGRELVMVNTADTAEDDLMGDFVDEPVLIIKKNKMQAVVREKIE